ncbi:MAG: hypothetical protein IJ445_02120 [Clostridia bacterium]|nr:hypothetical protein [Clostridia bacterium]
MLDIWSFLLQTLTVSGVAALILLIKALFKDKLPPKWQFAVWGVLGLIMLIPAGLFGRYTLFRWQIVIEMIKSLFGDYSFTRVYFPIPMITSMPTSVGDWLFVIYVLGIILLLFKYLISYYRLERILKCGNEVSGERLSKINEIAELHNVKIRRVTEVDGLPSAFVFGVFRSVLVVPKGKDLNEKIILHELFHLKNKDTVWSVVICLLKCFHWCNPLIVYCADKALNDMESRCDQYVLESLEGEERREYGKILLSMVSEGFSKTPGSTSINNGGRNIKDRIENIARFKKYPQGMGLVSICILILMALPLTMGAQASTVRDFGANVNFDLAYARSIPCTTMAGAFDTYAKSILDRNGYYRAMCAPENIQRDILDTIRENNKEGIMWNPGLNEWADPQGGYYIYNLVEIDKNTYEGLLVVKLAYPPNGEAGEVNMMYLATQDLRVEKENGRWVVTPLEDFKYKEIRTQTTAWGCIDLPFITYVGEANDIKIEVTYQTVHIVDNKRNLNNDFLFGVSSNYDLTLKPNAEFSEANRSNYSICTYLGDESEMNNITHIGLSFAPVFKGEMRPDNLMVPSGDHKTTSSTTGEQCVSMKLYPDWGPTLTMDGGGGGFNFEDVERPEYYAADLYLNNEKVASLDLLLQEGESK